MGNEILFQHYFVVYLDHLGQKDILKQVTGLPYDKDNNEIFIDLMKKSLGRVSKLRELFKIYFDSTAIYKPNLKLVPPELREEFALSQISEINYYSFSDTYVIVVPLSNNNEHCTAMNGIYSAFLATCGIGLMSLSEGIAVRGGLDIGIGSKIENNEIYGQGLARAAIIESERAEYPRYVIGDGLINYLYSIEYGHYSTRFGLISKESAKLCKSMIIRDNDGNYMLDFLGEKAKEGYGDSITAEVVKNAFNYVVTQHKHFRDKENYKIASRYFRLINYFRLRLPIWEA